MSPISAALMMISRQRRTDPVTMTGCFIFRALWTKLGLLQRLTNRTALTSSPRAGRSEHLSGLHVDNRGKVVAAERMHPLVKQANTAQAERSTQLSQEPTSKA